MGEKVEEEDCNIPLVIVYDYCVSRTPFQEIIEPQIDFAKHIFAATSIRSLEIRRSDKKLFAYVAEELALQYPNSKLIIITADRSFDREVCEHEAFQRGVVEVRILPPCNGKLMNRRCAHEVTQSLIQEYQHLRKTEGSFLSL